MIETLKQRIVKYGLISYVLLACLWWGYLLYAKTTTTFEAKVQWEHQKAAGGRGLMSRPAFEKTDTFKELEREYRTDIKQVLGEGLFLLLSIGLGIFFINQGFRREVALANQQRNFLLSITHELKSPIASIRLVLDTFMKRDLQSSQVKRFSRNGLKEVERLHNLVNNILLAARFESSYSTSLNFEEISLVNTVRSIIDQLEDKYPKVTFGMKAEEDIPYIKADKMAITSVVLNLIENAIKYTKGDAKIQVNLYDEQDNVVFEISDEGIGISDEEKPNVFEKFYRVGSEDTRQTKGTGLGLYIVKQIILAHQGDIIVKDNEPKGTIFQVALPLD